MNDEEFNCALNALRDVIEQYAANQSEALSLAFAVWATMTLELHPERREQVLQQAIQLLRAAWAKYGTPAKTLQ